MLKPTTYLPPCFQVRFASLYVPGRAMAFPCDDKGRVDLDALTDRARDNYLFARAMVGRDFSAPCVCPPVSTSAAVALAE